ncbi:nucleotidyltransferase [Clostridium sp. SY8519]|nr:nucleotidyltransferase [Clostridium sp. SY8519]
MCSGVETVRKRRETSGTLRACVPAWKRFESAENSPMKTGEINGEKPLDAGKKPDYNRIKVK